MRLTFALVGRRLRLLFATPAYAPAASFGGPIQVFERLVEGLTADGHGVEVLTTSLTALEERGAAPHPDGHARAGRRSGTSPRRSGSAGWASRPPFRWQLPRSPRPDLVHVFGFRDPLGTAVATWARFRHVPYVFEGLGMVEPKLRKVRLKRALDSTLLRGVLSGAALLVAASGRERDEYMAAGVAEGADRDPPERLPGARPVPAARALRARIGVDARTPLVLSVGRIARGKGLDLLVEAVSELPGVHAAIVGADGGHGMTGELEALRAAARCRGPCPPDGPRAARRAARDLRRRRRVRAGLRARELRARRGRGCRGRCADRRQRPLRRRRAASRRRRCRDRRTTRASCATPSPGCSRTATCGASSATRHAPSPPGGRGRAWCSCRRSSTSVPSPVADLAVAGQDPGFGGGVLTHDAGALPGGRGARPRARAPLPPLPEPRRRASHGPAAGPRRRPVRAGARRGERARSVGRRSRGRCAARGRASSAPRPRRTASAPWWPAGRLAAGSRRVSPTSGRRSSGPAAFPPRPPARSAAPSCGFSSAPRSGMRRSSGRRRRPRGRSSQRRRACLWRRQARSDSRGHRAAESAPGRGMAPCDREAGARLHRPRRRPAEEPVAAPRRLHPPAPPAERRQTRARGRSAARAAPRRCRRTGPRRRRSPRRSGGRRSSSCPRSRRVSASSSPRRSPPACPCS